MMVSATQRIKSGSVRESGWIAALDGVAMESFSEELTLKIRPELTSRSQPRKKQEGQLKEEGTATAKAQRLRHTWKFRQKSVAGV